ncbi:MAG: hypothetical protein ACE5D4_08520 [Thermodesulfobacteriota bacterium]
MDEEASIWRKKKEKGADMIKIVKCKCGVKREVPMNISTEHMTCTDCGRTGQWEDTAGKTGGEGGDFV